MADKKKLSQIHMDVALQLAPRLTEPGVSTELVASYLASAGTLLKARKEPMVMEALIEQAAELDAENAAELLADFFEQFKTWNRLSLGSLELPKPEVMATAALTGSPEAPPQASSSPS